MGRLIDCTGMKFGKLTVLRRAPLNTKTGDAIWYCICECGNVYKAIGTKLRSGHSKSCGCLRKTVIKEFNSKKAKRYFYDGDRLSPLEWSKDERAVVKDAHLIKQRLNTGWKIKEAILVPAQTNKYFFEGEYKTLSEWAKDPRSGVNGRHRLYQRLRKGWSFKEALLIPLKL